MLRMSVFIGCGYALGPLLGLVCELVVNAAEWKGSVVSSSTLPAWLMVILFLLECAAISVVVNDDAAIKKPKKKPAASTASSGIPWMNIVPFYLVVFIVPFNVASWEVNSVFYSTVDWGWSIELAALTLGLVNTISVLLAVLHFGFRRCIKDDRHGTIASFSLATIGSLMVFKSVTAAFLTFSFATHRYLAFRNQVHQRNCCLGNHGNHWGFNIDFLNAECKRLCLWHQFEVVKRACATCNHHDV